MKNNKKLSDAIGQIDQKYIDEYVNGQKTRRPMMWRAVIAAALAVALLAGAAIGIPALTKGNNELGDNYPQQTSPEIADSILSNTKREYITDAAGKNVLYVQSYAQLPEDIRAAFGFNTKQEAAEIIFINWKDIINTAKNSTSADELIFIGTPVSNEAYVWDEEITVTDNGGQIVEYDVASGTTAIKDIEGYEPHEPYPAVRRTLVQLIGIRIDEILKKNNTTGYEVGDTIYFYSENSRIITELDGVPEGETEIAIENWNASDIVTDAEPPFECHTEVAEAESGAYIPPYSPTTTYDAETAPAVSTVPELDINGDGKLDDIDREEHASHSTTLPSSGQRMYVAHTYTRSVSDIVTDSGLIPSDLWISYHSCTAEEYRSGNFPNDASKMFKE